MRARRAMALAHALSTDGTRPDFIGREQRGRLVRAGRPVPRAHHAPRSVGAAQVWRAMHLSIHHADGLMRRADGSAAAGALRHLVHAHRLVGAPLTVLEARRAQATASLGRLRVALLRVPVADDPAATAARSEARRAGLVPILGADALVCRAVLEPARRADADVFITCRLPVHATLGDAVVGAEVLGADRAAVGAGLAGAVVVPADRERRRRATAMRTCHDPGSRASQRPLRAERRATPPVRLERPLGARAGRGAASAASDGSAGSIRPASKSRNAPARSSPTLAPAERSYTSLSTTASSTPAPARSTTRATSRPTGCTATRVALRWTVPSRTGIVSSTLFGSLAAAGAIRPSDRRAARARIASISWERNGLPSTAISASGSRSSASSENAGRSDARSRKKARSD